MYTCQECGNTFEKKWKNGKGIFCTQTCNSKSLSKKMKIKQTGSGNIQWKGGRVFTGKYWILWIPEHPHASKKGYILEHRVVMEEMIGRYLTSKEQVHHINGNKSDNRPENLQLMTISEHHSYHMKQYWKEVKSGLRKREYNYNS